MSYINYLLLTDQGELECNDEAYRARNASKWELSMKENMESLISNQAWELAELPIGKKELHNKRMCQVNKEYDGFKRYKAQLVVK